MANSLAQLAKPLLAIGMYCFVDSLQRVSSTFVSASLNMADDCYFSYHRFIINHVASFNNLELFVVINGQTCHVLHLSMLNTNN